MEIKPDMPDVYDYFPNHCLMYDNAYLEGMCITKDVLVDCIKSFEEWTWDEVSKGEYRYWNGECYIDFTENHRCFAKACYDQLIVKIDELGDCGANLVIKTLQDFIRDLVKASETGGNESRAVFAAGADLMEDLLVYIYEQLDIELY